MKREPEQVKKTQGPALLRPQQEQTPLSPGNLRKRKDGGKQEVGLESKGRVDQ